MMKRLKGQRGAELLETAITLPIILLVSVSIFEFGRAYQTWQVLTNAAREGARIACLPDYTDTQVTTTVTNYMNGGRLNGASAAISVVRNVPFGATTASRVTVNYPFRDEAVYARRNADQVRTSPRLLIVRDRSGS